MEEPNEDLRAGGDEQPPDFGALTPPDELVRGGRTRDDFLDAVFTLDAPTPVDEIADLADHGTDAAREYLAWFERMGIVTRVTDTPATYVRNQEYFQWRRVQRLREQYSTDELLEFLREQTDRDGSFADDFDADDPGAVSISAHARNSERSLEDVWEDLSVWKTTRRRIRLLERALNSESEGPDSRRRAV